MSATQRMWAFAVAAVVRRLGAWIGGLIALGISLAAMITVCHLATDSDRPDARELQQVTRLFFLLGAGSVAVVAWIAQRLLAVHHAGGLLPRHGTTRRNVAVVVAAGLIVLVEAAALLLHLNGTTLLIAPTTVLFGAWLGWLIDRGWAQILMPIGLMVLTANFSFEIEAPSHPTLFLIGLVTILGWAWLFRQCGLPLPEDSRRRLTALLADPASQPEAAAFSQLMQRLRLDRSTRLDRPMAAILGPRPLARHWRVAIANRCHPLLLTVVIAGMIWLGSRTAARDWNWLMDLALVMPVFMVSSIGLVSPIVNLRQLVATDRLRPGTGRWVGSLAWVHVTTVAENALAAAAGMAAGALLTGTLQPAGVLWRVGITALIIPGVAGSLLISSGSTSMVVRLICAAVAIGGPLLALQAAATGGWTALAIAAIVTIASAAIAWIALTIEHRRQDRGTLAIGPALVG